MSDSVGTTTDLDANPGAAVTRPTVFARKIDGYHVYQQDAGDRFWNLFQKFRRGELEAVRLSNHARERDVFLFEDGGKKYVLKWDKGGWGFGGESRLERFFWRALRGPFYSRLMRRVRPAVAAGCEVIQDIHLVAERRTLHFCHEAVIILDYLEGDNLRHDENPARHYPEMREAIIDIHRRGLALCDVSFYNFLVTDRGIRMIDLVCRGNPRVDRVKDAVRMKKVFDIDIPLRGRIDHALFWALSRFQAARQAYANRKNEKRPPKRLRNFRE